MRCPKLLARLLCLLAGALAVGAPRAQDPAPPIELRYATGAVKESVTGRQIERWAEAVEQESRGALKVQVFFGGQLGGGLEIVVRVARGRVEMGGVSAAFAALLAPELQLLALPMFFRSVQELDCVLDSTLTPLVVERLAARGVRFDGWGGSGTLELIGRRAFTRPADVAGARVGTYVGRIGAIGWEALNASVVTTGPAEVAPAFQTGLIDATLSTLPYYVPSGLNKLAPVMSRAELIFMPTMNIMNRAAWDRLGPELQGALERARARVPLAEVRQQARDFEAEMAAAHLRGGGQIVELDAAQRAAFRSVFEQQWPRMVQGAGAAGAKFFERMNAGRQLCERKP